LRFSLRLQGLASKWETLAPVCHNPPMCGRYRLSRRKQILEEYFDCGSWEEERSPLHNIAPTQPIPVVRENPKKSVRELSLMRWGLIPHWAKDPSIATSTINAKSESAATKPAFRDPLKFRRCLMPAYGFYEWKTTATSKQPFCFEVNDGDLFAFAGLWDGWKNSGTERPRCSPYARVQVLRCGSGSERAALVTVEPTSRPLKLTTT
jgi:putative SOS response-associated peptidase YedK